MTVVDDLKAARAIIEKGWCQHALTDGRRFCAVGAINLATSKQMNPYCAAYDALQRHLPDEFHGVIPAFNDDPATTKRDVLDLFDKALADLGGLG